MNMISRRRMVKGLVAGLPLAAVLADHAFANPTVRATTKRMRR